MAYTETKSVGWLNRLGSSFRGTVVGLVLVVAGTALLWWNEGNYVATGDALTEAQGQTGELGDITRIDSGQNGRLVHATGPAETKDVLKDPLFGLEVNGIRLERRVEFFQWVENSSTETKTKLGGGEETVTTYTYKKQWVKQPVDSSVFKAPKAQKAYQNRVLINVGDFKAQAAEVTFGAYRLPESLISRISGAEPLNILLTEEAFEALNRQMVQSALGPMAVKPESALEDAEEAPAGQSASAPENAEEAPAETADAAPVASPAEESAAEEQTPEKAGQAPQSAPADNRQLVHIDGHTITLSVSPGLPQIGDVRVSFMETRPGVISILAKVNGDTFEAYQAQNGQTVQKLSMGVHSLENMYGSAHSANSMMTWILRLMGAFLVCIGLKTLAAPLEVLASVIPVLGRIVGAGTGLVSTLLGLAWSLAVISVAWLRFRPAAAIIILLVAGGLVALLFFRGRAGKAAGPEGA